MKIICAVLTVLLIASNVFWLYMVVDQAVTLSYVESSFDDLRKQNEQLISLANLDLKGLKFSEASELIGKDVYGLDPFVKEGCLNAGGVCLKLNKENRVEGFRLSKS